MPSLRFTRVLLIPMALFLCAACVTTTIDGRPTHGDLDGRDGTSIAWADRVEIPEAPSIE